MASTDSRFLRSVRRLRLVLPHIFKRGYPSIGFSPMINTPSLLHDHNEFLNEKTFLRGVEIYETIIDSIASI